MWGLLQLNRNTINDGQVIVQDNNGLTNLFCCLSLVICKWSFSAIMFCSCSSITCLRNLKKQNEMSTVIINLFSPLLHQILKQFLGVANKISNQAVTVNNGEIALRMHQLIYQRRVCIPTKLQLTCRIFHGIPRESVE